MTRTFCHICGRITSELYENKCRRCFIKEKSFLRLPKISLKVCRECLRYYKKGRWEQAGASLEEVLKKAAYNAVKGSLKVEMETPSIEIQVEEPAQASGKVYRVKCTVRASGEVSDIPCEEEASTEVKFAMELCKDCSRRAGGYFEAILQLRGRSDLAASCADELLSSLSGDQKASITSVKKLKKGTDIYFASTPVAKKSAKTLMEKFGGTLKESAHMHGVDKSGKNIYRVNISLRLPDFTENDVITFEGKTYQVFGFGRSRVSLFDLGSRNKRSFAFKSLEGARRLDGEAIKAVVLESIPGRIQVMETKNYKTLEFYMDLPLKAEDEVIIFKNSGVFLLRTTVESQ